MTTGFGNAPSLNGEAGVADTAATATTAEANHSSEVTMSVTPAVEGVTGPTVNVNPFNAINRKTLRNLAANFNQLSDATRLEVVLLLLDKGEMNVTNMCDHVDKTQPALSHHLALLKLSGILEARRDGKNNFYTVSDSFTRQWKDVLAQLIVKDSE